MTSKTFIVGDIHGTIDEFKEILTLLDYKSPNVRIILLGDVVDRGFDSVGVIRLARELKLECVLGNHELKLIKWLQLGSNRPPLHEHNTYYSKLNTADLDYIFDMPLYIKIDNNIIAHAGLRAGVPLEKQTRDDLCYIRYIDTNGRFISLKKIVKQGKEALGAHFWTEYGSFGYNVIYGHNVDSLTDIRVDKFQDGTACYGLDTGACFGGRLTAMELNSKEIIQVQAKQVYFKSWTF